MVQNEEGTEPPIPEEIEGVNLRDILSWMKAGQAFEAHSGEVDAKFLGRLFDHHKLGAEHMLSLIGILSIHAGKSVSIAKQELSVVAIMMQLMGVPTDKLEKGWEQMDLETLVRAFKKSVEALGQG